MDDEKCKVGCWIRIKHRERVANHRQLQCFHPVPIWFFNRTTFFRRVEAREITSRQVKTVGGSQITRRWEGTRSHCAETRIDVVVVAPTFSVSYNFASPMAATVQNRNPLRIALISRDRAPLNIGGTLMSRAREQSCTVNKKIEKNNVLLLLVLTQGFLRLLIPQVHSEVALCGKSIRGSKQSCRIC